MTTRIPFSTLMIVMKNLMEELEQMTMQDYHMLAVYSMNLEKEMAIKMICLEMD